MASYKNYLIAFLSITTVAGAYLSWQQSRELVVVRSSAATEETQAELRKRIWDAEKRVQSMTAELAGARETKPGGNVAVATAPTETANRRDTGAFMGLMDNPEYQKLMTIQQRAMLDGRYAALFRKLKLSPQQLEQFKQLLVERQTSMIDLMAVARAEGFDPRNNPEAYRKLITDTQAEVDQTIKTALGETAYAEYRNYEATAPFRNVMAQLEQRLSYHGTALSETQGEQLVQILAEANQALMAAPAPFGVGMRVATATFTGSSSARASNVVNFMTGSGAIGAIVTDEVVTRASGVLAPDQLAALQQIQQEQAAAVEMGRLMRAQMGQGNRPGSGTPVLLPAVRLPGP